MRIHFIGQETGCGATSSTHCYNTYIGCGAGRNQTDGQRNILIGCKAAAPVLDGSDQLAIVAGGQSGSPGFYFLAGCCTGGCVYVGIGTTKSDDVVGAGLTSKLSVGIVSAYQLYGDGSNLTGISAGGFSQDDHANLVAGDGAGAAIDSDTCFNIMIGCNSGAALNSGDKIF